MVEEVPLPSKHAIGVANALFKVLLMEATVLPMHLNYKQRNTYVYVLKFVLSYST